MLSEKREFKNLAIVGMTLAALMSGLIAEETAERDPWKWPFRSDSIWNQPIGSEAVYVPAGIGAAKTIGIDYERLHRVAKSAPLRPVFAPKSWETRAGGKRRLGVIAIEDDFLVPDARKFYTPNECAAFLMPDGRTLKQIGPLCRPKAGGDVYGYLFEPDEDLYGTGITGSHGGSGLSAIGGSIRLGELISGKPIRHVLKINLYCKRFVHHDEVNRGFRWPASRADSYAADEYGGTNPALRMGALLAIPPSTDITSLGLKTQIGNTLYRALVDYGAYVPDDSAWDCHYLCAEFGVAEEIEEHFGMPFSRGSTDFLHDINALFAVLHVVDNNGPDRIGGGGEPRVAMAPPLPETTLEMRPLPNVPVIANRSMTRGEEQVDHWTDRWVKSGNLKILRDTTVYRSEPASLRIESVGGAVEGQVRQVVPAWGGIAFEIRGEVRSEVTPGTRVVFGIQGYDANWKPTGFLELGLASGTQDWMSVAKEVVLPAKTTRAAAVLQLQGEGKAWLDDVEVTY